MVMIVTEVTSLELLQAANKKINRMIKTTIRTAIQQLE